MSKKLIVLIAAVMACGQRAAVANDFYATTNELGYFGTVANTTVPASGTMATPRDAEMYVVNGDPATVGSNYNILNSDWSEEVSSNSDDSYMQLYEEGLTTVTSATASWDATGTEFTMTVSGVDATYATSYSRMWQPDDGTAGEVDFLNYTYTLTADFATAATVQDGYLANSSDATAMSGTFSGNFLSTETYYSDPHFGDTYSFNVGYSLAQWDTNQGVDPIGDPYGYGDGTGTPFDQFGVLVPLPSAFWSGMTLVGCLGLLGAAKRKQQLV